MRFITLIIMCIMGCTAPDASRRALENQGFTDIKTGGYDAWACSEDDTFATKFTAKNAQGKPVSGAVCCGIMKNCTIRW